MRYRLLLTLLLALPWLGLLHRAWPTDTLTTTPTVTDDTWIATETPVSTGYIHACPNQDPTINTTLCDNGNMKGFVDDNGHRFIPNGLNTARVWHNRPNRCD